MKQFLSLLVAAVFAAVSVNALAQEKKAETKMEKEKSSKTDKKAKSPRKAAAKKKSEEKK